MATAAFPVRMMLVGLVLAFAIDDAAAWSRTKPSVDKQTERLMALHRREAMIFFIAKGEPDACGPGCAEWIAAEGVVDAEAAIRLRNFLTTLQGRTLPIFFNSRGGTTNAAVEIGRILRDRRIKAGVGRTILVGCRAAARPDEACRRLIQSRVEHRARFVAGGSMCASACVYAIIGGVRRQFSPETTLGVHSVRLVWTQKGSRPVFMPTVADAHRRLKEYVLEMGVDPGLIDLAAKTPHDRIHYMTRQEITRLGVETQKFFETPWIYQPSGYFGSGVVWKSWTSASGTDARTFRISLSCKEDKDLHLLYRGDTTSVDASSRPAAGLTVEGASLTFMPLHSSSQTHTDVRTASVSADFLKRAAVSRDMQFVEMTPGNPTTRMIKLSTAGLVAAVSNLQKSCYPSVIKLQGISRARFCGPNIDPRTCSLGRPPAQGQ